MRKAKPATVAWFSLYKKPDKKQISQSVSYPAVISLNNSLSEIIYGSIAHTSLNVNTFLGFVHIFRVNKSLQNRRNFSSCCVIGRIKHSFGSAC